MSRRKEQLFSAASTFNAIHEAWSTDDNRGNMPDEIYWDGVTDLVEIFDHGDIPGDCRSLFDAVMKFADEADAYQALEIQGAIPDSFWNARKAIEKVVDGEPQRILRPLEPIAELMKLPYMQPVQVCNIYGFKDRKGNPMPHLVQMELDSPGSVIGPSAKGKGLIDGRDWCDPRLPVPDKDSHVDGLDATETKNRRAKRDSQPCKETDRELWEQGVGPEQAAKMLKQDSGEVRKRFDDWTAAAAFNRKVWGLVDQSVPTTEICKQLRTDPKKVEAAIKERERIGSGQAGGDSSEAA